MSRAVLAALAAVLSLAAYAQAGRHIEMPRQPETVDIAGGQAVYDEVCAACHGAKLEGEPNWRVRKEDGTLPAPPHDPSGHTWHHGDGVLFLYTRLGGQGFADLRGLGNIASGMPGFEDQLTDQDIWNVLAFIKSTWPAKIQQEQRERSALE